MSKDYLKYLFKSKKSLCVVVIVLYILFFVTAVVSNSEALERFVDSLLVNCIITGLLAYALVPIFFSFIHNKKAVDAYFALPVTRKEMIVTSLFFIDIVILIPFIVLSFVSFMMGIASHLISSLVLYIAFELIVIVGVIVVTLFNTSLFIEANNTFDGIVMIFAYECLPFVILIATEVFQTCLIAGFRPIENTRILSYLSLPASVVIAAIPKIDLFIGRSANEVNEFTKALPTLKFIICIAWHVLVSLIIIRRNFIERKVERAENISDRFFSYPFVIYVYTLLLVLMVTLSSFDNRGDFAVLIVVVFVCYMIGKFIYRRSISIKPKDIIYYFVVVVIAFIFTFASNKTKGFGLSYGYDQNPKNIAFEYELYNFDNNDEDVINLVKEVYPNATYVSIHIDGAIKEKAMSNAQDVVKLLETKRLQAINNYYDTNNHDDAALLITTNYDEKTNVQGSMTSYYLDAKDYCRYYSSPYLSLDEINLLNNHNFNIIFTIEDENDYYGINYYDLLKQKNNK